MLLLRFVWVCVWCISGDGSFLIGLDVVLHPSSTVKTRSKRLGVWSPPKCVVSLTYWKNNVSWVASRKSDVFGLYPLVILPLSSLFLDG